MRVTYFRGWQVKGRLSNFPIPFLKISTYLGSMLMGKGRTRLSYLNISLKTSKSVSHLSCNWHWFFGSLKNMNSTAALDDLFCWGKLEKQRSFQGKKLILLPFFFTPSSDNCQHGFIQILHHYNVKYHCITITHSIDR